MRGVELRPNDGVALAVLPSGDTYADCLFTNSGIVLAVLESIGSCFTLLCTLVGWLESLTSQLSKVGFLKVRYREPHLSLFLPLLGIIFAFWLVAQDGRKHGRGMYVRTFGQSEAELSWESGYPVWCGWQVYADQTAFKGEWVNDFLDGAGTSEIDLIDFTSKDLSVGLNQVTCMFFRTSGCPSSPNWDCSGGGRPWDFILFPWEQILTPYS